MKIIKFCQQQSGEMKRMVFFDAGPEGAKVEAPKTEEKPSDKPDYTTLAGREKIYRRAEDLIQKIKDDAQKSREAGDEKTAGRLDFKAKHLQNALDAARLEEKENSRPGLESSNDYSSQQASKELMKRMDWILHPSKEGAKTKVSAADMAALDAASAKMTASLGIDTPKPAPLGKPEAPVKAPEKNVGEPSNALKTAVRNYASSNFGDAVKEFKDPQTGVLWEVSITGNTDPENKNAKISYKRKADSDTINVTV